MKKRVLVVSAAMAWAIGMAGSALRASTIAQVEAQASGTAAVLDNNPVITAILSQPGTVNGRTYSSWAVLANDGTGSIELFGTMPGGYTPTVGDAVSVNGTNSPFHQIPEIGSISAITANTSGNPIPPIGVATIAQLNVSAQPLSNVGYLWELDNVTISGQGLGSYGDGTWGTSNSPSGATIMAGGTSMTLYNWPTSYSVANSNLAHQMVPTGPCNMIGFVSDFTSGSTTTAEFTPISVTPVPEPASVALLGIGALFLTGRRRKASSRMLAPSHGHMAGSRQRKGL